MALTTDVRRLAHGSRRSLGTYGREGACLLLLHAYILTPCLVSRHGSGQAELGSTGGADEKVRSPQAPRDPQSLRSPLSSHTQSSDVCKPTKGTEKVLGAMLCKPVGLSPAAGLLPSVLSPLLPGIGCTE